jgi:hypothetical protein
MIKLKTDISHIKRIAKLIFIVLIYVGYFGATIFLLLQFGLLKNKSDNIEEKVAEIQKSQEDFGANFSEELFEDHLKYMESLSLEGEVASLSTQLEDLSLTQTGSLALKVKSVYDLYSNFQAKLVRNDAVKVDTAASKTKTKDWGQLLIDKKFDELSTALIAENTSLDAGYQKYIDSLPKAAPAGNGYSYLTVTTERGTTHGVYLIKVPLSQVRVKTLAAVDGDCKNDCDTKTLAEYVSDGGGYAGINGSYNCPPDYSSCAGKTNSFDFALYDSNDRKWINKGALSWGDTGMVTFSGHSASMYKKTSDYGGNSVDAALSNYPSLLKNGDVVVDDDDLTSFQKTKGLRGAIGFGGENLYLAHINNANINDAAYVMKALGAQNALNLDGGGSAAMYINGGYAVGPGRRLSNAIVLVK